MEHALEDSRQVNISVHAMYPEIWGADLPKSRQKLSSLCRFASVDELKGIFRLSVRGMAFLNSAQSSNPIETVRNPLENPTQKANKGLESISNPFFFQAPRLSHSANKIEQVCSRDNPLLLQI